LKKLTILLITFFGIYLIYNVYKVNKINYVSLNDLVINYDKYVYKHLLDKKIINNYNNSFNSFSILDLYNTIKNNRTIKENNEILYLKKVLRESDVLVISVGMMELINNFNKYNMTINYDYFSKMYSSIKGVIKEIKKYAYGKIIFLGYYNPTNYYDANIDSFFYEINIKLERLLLENNIIYIDLYTMIKENNYKEKYSFSLNDLGNKKIASIINYYLD